MHRMVAFPRTHTIASDVAVSARETLLEIQLETLTVTRPKARASWQVRTERPVQQTLLLRCTVIQIVTHNLGYCSLWKFYSRKFRKALHFFCSNNGFKVLDQKFPKKNRNFQTFSSKKECRNCFTLKRIQWREFDEIHKWNSLMKLIRLIQKMKWTKPLLKACVLPVLELAY